MNSGETSAGSKKSNNTNFGCIRPLSTVDEGKVVEVEAEEEDTNYRR